MRLAIFVAFFIASCEAKTMFAHVGDDVEMSCGNNFREPIVWTKRDFFSRGSFIISKNENLKLKSVQSKDSGTYACAFDGFNSIELIIIDGFKNAEAIVKKLGW